MPMVKNGIMLYLNKVDITKTMIFNQEENAVPKHKSGGGRCTVLKNIV